MKMNSYQAFLNIIKAYDCVEGVSVAYDRLYEVEKCVKI